MSNICTVRELMLDTFSSTFVIVKACLQIPEQLLFVGCDKNSGFSECVSIAGGSIHRVFFEYRLQYNCD